jgi:predicted ATPase/DNA-binding SARP family transcriptional activator
MGFGFRILGPLEVENVSSLGGPKPRTLLARLLLEPNRVVSYEELIDVLWPEDPPEQARHTLQVYVSSLRRALGHERIRADRSGYAVQVERGELDLARFEELAAEGASRLRAGDPERAQSCFAEALSLWRGPPLADIAPALEPERATLEELRLAAEEEQLESGLALGRHAGLVPRLEALVRRHPTRERLRRQLMLALYRSGRQADALEQYRDARRTLVEELGLEPSTELRELETAILRQDPALALTRDEVPESRRHLPAPATPFVGRRREVEEITALFAAGARLVTLTGPGGSGKTRLALRAAEELATEFADGVLFVGLGALGDPAFVPAEIARPLGIEDADGPHAALANHLRSRSELLVLDNFEHVMDAAADVASLLAEAPALKLLVTSRHALRVYGEHEYPVDPLALEDEAVPLFLQRALAVGRRLEANESVRELCLRLDCLPLAIELAAARTRELSLRDLQSGLRRLEVAVGGLRDVPARQQTLRATIEWSYDLLDTDERPAFESLGVFVGSWSSEDAEAVAGARPETIGALADKSLVRRDIVRAEAEFGDGMTRYAMLETIREYALERLEARGEAEVVRRRHAMRLLELAEAAEPALDAGADQAVWLERLALEHDNLRAALTWLGSAGETELRLRLATALKNFWWVQGHLTEGRRTLEEALAGVAGSPALRAEALTGLGQLAYRQGAFEAAKRAWEESLELYRQLRNGTGIARSIGELGSVAYSEGDYERAVALYEESAALFREAGDRMRLAPVLANLGAIANNRGDYERGRRLTEEALALHREFGAKDDVALTLHNLGRVALHERRYADAADLLRESLALSRELSFKEMIAYGLAGSAEVAAVQDNAERAAHLIGAAESLLDETGVRLDIDERQSYERTVEALRARLGTPAFETKRAEGRALALDRAIEVALETRA